MKITHIDIIEAVMPFTDGGDFPRQAIRTFNMGTLSQKIHRFTKQ